MRGEGSCSHLQIYQKRGTALRSAKAKVTTNRGEWPTMHYDRERQRSRYWELKRGQAIEQEQHVT